MLAGAVYRPVCDTVPTPAGVTLHVTPGLSVFVTASTNCRVCPTNNVAVFGVTSTVTGTSAIAAEPDFWASRIHNDDRPRVLAALDRRRADGVWSIQYR